jgi:hypothetical protein
MKAAAVYEFLWRRPRLGSLRSRETEMKTDGKANQEGVEEDANLGPEEKNHAKAKERTARPVEPTREDDPNPSDSRKAIERVRLAISGAGALAKGAAAADPTTAIASALLTFIPSALSFAVPHVFERKKTRAQAWWDEVVFANASDEGAAAEVKARLNNDPNAQDAIMTGLRDAMDATAIEVLPAIALLTREYARAGRKPDRFFRGLSRILVDLVAEEYEPLRLLMQHTATAPHSDERSQVHLQLMPADQRPPTMETTEVACFSQIAGFAWLPVQIPHAARLFEQLKVNGLASDIQVIGFDSPALPFSMVMERAVAARIARLLPDAT